MAADEVPGDPAAAEEGPTDPGTGSSPSQDSAAPPHRCPNCGTIATGEFCPSCGQAQREKVLSLRRLAADFVEQQLDLDSRLPRTVVPLLFRPGLLTREYLRGRIARYFTPFRVYLVASLIFFLILSFRSQGGVVFGLGEAEPAAPVDSIVESTETGAPLPGEVEDPSGTGASEPTSGDTLQVDTAGDTRSADQDVEDSDREVITGDEQVETGSETLNRFVRAQQRKFAGLTYDEAIDRVGREMMRQAPKAMFLLLPAFALLLKLLYVRSGRLYVEHFIFALHVHAFWFLAFAFLLLLPSGWIERLVWLWAILYLLFALRRVYGQGWWKTGVKYGALGCAYWLIISIALVGVALLALVLA